MLEGIKSNIVSKKIPQKRNEMETKKQDKRKKASKRTNKHQSVRLDRKNAKPGGLLL